MFFTNNSAISSHEPTGLPNASFVRDTGPHKVASEITSTFKTELQNSLPQSAVRATAKFIPFKGYQKLWDLMDAC